MAPLWALRHACPDDATLGRLGERLVARTLARQGYRLLGQRLVTREAELDLCALEPAGQAGLVVIEVKTGRLAVTPEAFAASDGWRPGHRFRYDDVERVRRAARRLGTRMQTTWRVDLIEVLVFPDQVRMLHHVDVDDALPIPGHHQEAWFANVDA